jgi:hypothetical protein
METAISRDRQETALPLDRARLTRRLDHETELEAEQPETVLDDVGDPFPASRSL